VVSPREARIAELKRLRRELQRTLRSAGGAFGDGLQDVVERIDKRIDVLKKQPAGPMFQEETS
jgi:hypothetical protein